MMAITDAPREIAFAVQLRALVEMAADWPTDEQRARFIERIRNLQGEAEANFLRREIWAEIKRRRLAAGQGALFG